MTAEPLRDPNALLMLLYRLYPAFGSSGKHEGIYLLYGDGHAWLAQPGITSGLETIMCIESVLTGPMGIAVSLELLDDLQELGLVVTPNNYAEGAYVKLPLKVRRAVAAGARTIEQIEEALTGSPREPQIHFNLHGANYGQVGSLGNSTQSIGSINIGIGTVRDPTICLRSLGFSVKEAFSIVETAQVEAAETGEPVVRPKGMTKLWEYAGRAVSAAGVAATSGAASQLVEQALPYLRDLALS